MNPREQVEAQRAGHGEHQHDQAIDQAGLFPAPTEQIHAAGQNGFKNSQDGRQGGEGHKDKEQCPPQIPQRHVVKHIG